MTDWKIVHGDIEPAEIDTTSSPTTVYERRNIKYVEPEVVTTESGEVDSETTPTPYWEYEERTYTPDEYKMVVEMANRVGQNIEIKRESEIIDEYTLSLIEEGVI
jgi:hypothetical protein